MKPLLVKIRSGRTPDAQPVASDDTLGRGMEIALTVLFFLVAGWLIDRWLGVFPLFTIALVLLAAAGTFVRLRYTYEAAMQQHEQQLRAARTNPTRTSRSRAADTEVESLPGDAA